MNNKGSLLVVTLTFVLIFTLLGFGAIRLAGLQNELAEKQEWSMEAFWLADGAVARASQQLPTKLFPAGQYVNIPLGNGTYDVSSARDVIKDSQGNVIYTYQFQWVIDAQGTVRNQNRKIHAILSALDMRFNIMTRGTIKDMDKCPQSSIIIDCTLVKEHANFSLDNFFQGLNTAAIKNMADYTYRDPNNAGDVNPISGLTVVNLVEKSSLNITTDNSNGTVLLIVDTTAVSGNPQKPPQINIEGNPYFFGVIWIRGEAKITGTSRINGAVVVEGASMEETKLSGNLTLEYDEEAIERAVSLLGYSHLVPPGPIKIINWEEI